MSRRTVAPKKARQTSLPATAGVEPYDGLVGGIAEILEVARRTSARAVNAVMTATYWEIGRRIVEYEQGGKARAEYGEALLTRLAADLTRRYGRGFGWRNLFQMRTFFLAYAPDKLQTASAISGPTAAEKPATPKRISGSARTLLTPSEESLPNYDRPTSGESGAAILQMLSGRSALPRIAARFPLPWSAYVRLLSVKNENARAFYESEALRGGWSVRQLDRQIQ